MIRSFKNKGLAELWSSGRTAKIDARMSRRILRRLEALDEAAAPQDMNLQGFDFHPLKDTNPQRYTVHVNGPWCVTFEFKEGDAINVDYEQYH